MDSGIRSLLSSGHAIERSVETIANNLSNSNTDGYKSDQPTFREVLSRASQVAPQSTEESFTSHEYLHLIPNRSHSAVTVDEIGKDFSPGLMKQTGNDLDLALGSEGFFTVLTPQGERFTRDGNFQLNAQKQMVNQDGFLVLGNQGPITIKGSQVQVTNEGSISVDGTTQSNTLKLVKFQDPNRLQKLGRNLLAPVDASNSPVVTTNARVQQGALEGSNVNTIKEMTRLITANRAYEMVQKALSNIDGLNEKALTIARA